MSLLIPGSLVRGNTELQIYPVTLTQNNRLHNKEMAAMLYNIYNTAKKQQNSQTTA